MNLTFSQKGYRDFLRNMMERQYKFRDFSSDSLHMTGRVCIIRHDVDADPFAAYRLALIESEYGIKSTYFFMLRSPVYNLFARENSRLVEKIILAGHDLGLHYDEGFKSNLNLQQGVEQEVSFLQRMFGVKIGAVSFHQPSKSIINNEIGIDNYINTYDKVSFKNFTYFSDSNMVWPADDFSRCLNMSNAVQVNLHPLWWAFEGSGHNTMSSWDAALLRNIDRTQDQLVETERAYGLRRKVCLTRS